MSFIVKNMSTKIGRNLLTTLSAVIVLTALVVSIPVAAANGHKNKNYNHNYKNDRRDWNNGRDWNHQMSWGEHQRRARDWRYRYRAPYPSVVYAPPPVIYYPPEPPSGISFIFPFDFR